MSNYNGYLAKIFQHLSQEDLANCKLVCHQWSTVVTSITLFDNKFDQIMLEPIVDKIISYLDTCKNECRLINSTFNFMVKYQVQFVPLLTDITRQAVLCADSKLSIKKLKAKDLYLTLPQTDEGFLPCQFDRLKVTSLEFFEGVTAPNKKILLKSFPHLIELSLLGTTNFTHLWTSDFLFLQKFKLQTDGCNDDTDSLVEFLTKGKFPILKQISIDLYVRRDFLVYFAVHNFIANHYSSVKKVELKFSAKHDYKPRDSLSGIVITYTMTLVKQFHQLINTFNLLQLEDLSIHFLPFEGTSLFLLSFALAESQEHLKNLTIYKEFTYTRIELLPLSSIIMRNEKTLINLDIPHPYTFDCTTIQDCNSLKCLSIGKSTFGRHQMMFSDSDIFQITNCCPNLQIFKVSIRLGREQIDWITQNLRLVEFFFYGYQGEQYRTEDINLILHRQKSKLNYLGFNCEMTKDDFQLLQEFCLDSTKGIQLIQCNYGEEEFYVALGDSRAKFEMYVSPHITNAR